MKSWAKYLLQCLGFVKRQSSKTVQASTLNFASLEEHFSYDARVLIDMMEIPGLTVINWDQTGIQYVHVSQWTMGLWREKAWNRQKSQVVKINAYYSCICGDDGWKFLTTTIG